MKRLGSFAGVGCALLLSLATGCPKEEPKATVDAAAPDSAMASAVDSGGEGGPELSEADTDVRPVYPIDPKAPADPLAARFCTALHETPETKRAACCAQKVGIVFTGECTRTLSAAIAAKALSIAAADVDKCAAAVEKVYGGCDWPGPFPPELPGECEGILKGALPVGTRCRSSLECAGKLRCFGVGPTSTGRCGDAHADAGKCGGTVDTLAAYTRQNDVDTTHPECTGYCNRSKCASFVAEGGTCTTGFQCGEGKLCITGKCKTAAPAKLGEPCPGASCEKGAQCIENKCIAKKAAGATCTMDFECVGGCLKPDAGNKGVCGKKCALR